MYCLIALMFATHLKLHPSILSQWLNLLLEKENFIFTCTTLLVLMMAPSTEFVTTHQSTEASEIQFML